MRLKRLELVGFKSFAPKTVFLFEAPITAVVGPNGSGKSNIAEAFRFVLGERSFKQLRGRRGEDLIFHGAAARGAAARAAVTLVFANQQRQFAVDFDEVNIGREVYRDGASTYLINGSAVRHRDIVELLSAAALGAADRFIIHQGEADRMLLAGTAERRLVIEDALGLRLYQWKIEESEKKLARTEENMKQVAALRREIAPHLKFLKKQVEKIEQVEKWRRDLLAQYRDYFWREADYLRREREALAAASARPRRELEAVEEELVALSSKSVGQDGEVEQERTLKTRQESLTRQLGRLEGRLEAAGLTPRGNAERHFTFGEVAAFVSRLEERLNGAAAAVNLPDRQAGLSVVQNIIRQVKEMVREFISPVRDKRQDDTDRLPREIKAVTDELKTVSEALETLDGNRQTLLRRREETLSLKQRQSQYQAELQSAAGRQEKLMLEEADFQRELAEASALVGQAAEQYPPGTPPAEERSAQTDRRRQIEKLKIRLEDSGVESDDTLKEYRESSERDEFLAKELSDLESGAGSLRGVIDELRQKISAEFQSGLRLVNRHFQDFFSLMFGGGSAALTEIKLQSERPDEENEAIIEGLEIKVSLPRKKIRGLEMLSGGERALVSIALLFALSQVNPPPFLVLDETDAALDESNSRKYADLLENLSQRSQLVLITHNRETMSRAGVLYGVTMAQDGVSRVLSIKFDEAAGYAK